MTYAIGTTHFPDLGLVRNVKFTCDVTVVYINDSIHGVCFPAVIHVSILFILKHFSITPVNSDVTSSYCFRSNQRTPTPVFKQSVYKRTQSSRHIGTVQKLCHKNILNSAFHLNQNGLKML